MDENRTDKGVEEDENPDEPAEETGVVWGLEQVHTALERLGASHRFIHR